MMKTIRKDVYKRQDLDRVEINAFFPIKERTNAFESVGYVDIPFCRLDIVMSHKLFHYLDVGSLLQQVSGERMAQQVRINPVSYTHLDVYKRQPLLCLVKIQSRIFLCIAVILDGVCSLIYTRSGIAIFKPPRLTKMCIRDRHIALSFS